MDKIYSRNRMPAPPRGLSKVKWYGPGLLWMLSAVGTGSVLFTPRVASAYGYTFLWLLLLVVFFMWVMIREMARFSIVTGRTMLEGMSSLAGPRGWAVWIIFLPQLLAAAVGIAGLAAVVSSALASVFPGGNRLYAVGVIASCALLTATGRYENIERVSRVMALLLVATAVLSAAVVLPDSGKLVQGLALGLPDDPDLYIILPWVGTILAGSMGIVWFGYWTASRGFGGGLVEVDQEDTGDISVRDARQWLRVMTGTATLGVLGGLVVISSFMVLGAQLLAPSGSMPKGADVAVDLTQLFSGVWGEPGRYLLLCAIVVAIGGSILANQDGWGRSFADMTRILTRKSTFGSSVQKLPLQSLFIVVVTGIIPVAIVLLFEDPVSIMSVSGIIAAFHTPFIVLLALFVNRTRLPEALRPGVFGSALMLAASLFYLGFAGLYLVDLFLR